MNKRAVLVGELAVADTERARLEADVSTAAARGRQFIAQAEADAARLVTAAQDLAQNGQQRYADAYTAATAGGWAPADLTHLGFAPSSSKTVRRRRPAGSPRTQQTPMTLTLPAQVAPADQDLKPAAQ